MHMQSSQTECKMICAFCRDLQLLVSLMIVILVSLISILDDNLLLPKLSMATRGVLEHTEHPPPPPPPPPLPSTVLVIVSS